MRSPGVVAVLLFLCTPAFAAEQLHLAMPGLTPVGLAASRGQFFGEHLASALIRAGARVTTQKAIGEVLGLERQKQLLGCSDSGCAVELANALGADAIVSGEVAQLGESLQCNLKILSATTSDALEVISLRASSDEALLDELEGAAQRLAQSVAPKLGRELRPQASQKGGVNWRKAAIAPTVVGALGVLGGIGLLVGARVQYGAIPSAGSASSVPYATAVAMANTGKTLQLAGWVAFGAGLGLIAAGAAMCALGGSPAKPGLVFFATPEGGALALGGEW